MPTVLCLEAEDSDEEDGIDESYAKRYQVLVRPVLHLSKRGGR